MKYELYHCRDARSFRVLWALEELGLEYELHMLNFPPRVHHPNYLTLNPLGTVPSFLVDDKLMTESCAIVEYLAAVSKSELSLTKEDSTYPEFLDWIHRADATLTFPQTLVLRYSKFEQGERKNAQITEDYTRWFLSRAKHVERALSEQEYLVAGRFSAADICVGYSLFLAKLLGLEDKLGEKTQAYLTRLMERKAFKASIEIQSDMEFYLA